jgi:hypothetical protein
MMLLSALGEFPEMVLGLAFSFGCALLLAFLCLRFLVGLMTRQQYSGPHDHNVMDDARQVRSIVWLGAAVAGANNGPAVSTDVARTDAVRTEHDRRSGSTGGPYILPAAAPRNRFTRIAEPDAAPNGRLVEISRSIEGRVAQAGLGDSGDAA